MRPVSVIGGTGDLGSGLALRLALAGTPVLIGSRDHQRAETIAQSLAGRAGATGIIRGRSNAAAAAEGEIVVLAVPFSAHAATLADIGEHLRPEQVLVDTTVPLASAVGGPPTQALGAWAGSVAQETASRLPGIQVVSGLHTIAAAKLTDTSRPLDQDILLCGDDAQAKERVARLLNAIPGARCVDCGPLAMSRTTEGLTPMMIGINQRYRAKTGITIAGLPGGSWP